LYISKGYLNSGAFLPEQDITDGILKIQIVEGDLEDIEINQTRYINAQRLERQLRSRIGRPLNVNQLELVLERLRRQPVVDSVKASLSGGSASGLSILELNIKENSPASVILQMNNYNTPGFGEWQGNIAFNHESLFGIEDQLTLQYGITEGSDNWGASYSIPLNLQDISYVEGDSEIIEAPFADLNINSNSETFSVGFTHPVFWKEDEEFNIGISLDLQESETFLFDCSLD
jgi:hemolysin activation/secretion protein